MESMRPVIFEKSWDAPEDCQRFNCPCTFSHPHIFNFKPKFPKYFRYSLFCAFVIATDEEHGRSCSSKIGIVHQSTSNAVKRLYKVRSGAIFCRRSMSDSSRLVKYFSTPFCGGASAIGLVASMTVLPDSSAFTCPTTFSAVS
jgi:hypothetical protein